MIQQMRVTFEPQAADRPLDRRQITGSGLHGLLFRTVFPAQSAAEADWLHGHEAPKPYALMPLYAPDNGLTGLQLSMLTNRAADLVVPAWQRAAEQGQPLALGKQVFQVAQVAVDGRWAFTDLLENPPQPEMTLRFVTPTRFRQGPGSLPLPLPRNVFYRPWQVWQRFAPASLQLPPDWLDWCQANVFVRRHRIQTATTRIRGREQFTGFVGRVEFEALDGDDTYLRLWQALGQLIRHCGTGHKTTMGMGAVA
jgi:CRISPR-associated endoribonuclease Cas6